jgi:preprotein translocase subunit SecD
VFSENKIYSFVIYSAGLISIIVAPLIIYHLKDVGAAIAVMIIEMYILLGYIYATEKKGYSLFKIKNHDITT